MTCNSQPWKTVGRSLSTTPATSSRAAACSRDRLGTARAPPPIPFHIADPPTACINSSTTTPMTTSAIRPSRNFLRWQGLHRASGEMPQQRMQGSGLAANPGEVSHSRCRVPWHHDRQRVRAQPGEVASGAASHRGSAAGSSPRRRLACVTGASINPGQPISGCPSRRAVAARRTSPSRRPRVPFGQRQPRRWCRSRPGPGLRRRRAPRPGEFRPGDRGGKVAHEGHADIPMAEGGALWGCLQFRKIQIIGRFVLFYGTVTRGPAQLSPPQPSLSARWRAGSNDRRRATRQAHFAIGTVHADPPAGGPPRSGAVRAARPQPGADRGGRIALDYAN